MGLLEFITKNIQRIFSVLLFSGFMMLCFYALQFLRELMYPMFNNNIVRPILSELFLTLVYLFLFALQVIIVICIAQYAYDKLVKPWLEP